MFVNLDFILSTTTVLDALKVSSMISIKLSAESNAAPIKSTISTVTNVSVLRVTILFRVHVLNVFKENLMMLLLRLAAEFLVKVSMNSSVNLLNNVSVKLPM